MPRLETLLLKLTDIKVIDSSISYSDYTPIDLSVTNSDLAQIDISNPKNFDDYVENYLKNNNAKIAFGGYNEIRNLYKQSTLFNDRQADERNIHIGMDIWAKTGTPIVAALDGVVYGFANNSGKGNYGPTIILEHTIENQKFYTLYGHLSVESIADLVTGTAFKKGQQLATLGDSTVNGGYSPHLHFQIIKNIETNFGDYPGVCSKKDLAYYLENCPDPNLLLKIQ